MAIRPDFLEKIKNSYSYIHPLIFHRSVEKTNSEVELFDILDSLPQEYPVVWSEADRRWVTTRDLVQTEKFDLGMEKKND
jgi:hypothetical protein